MSHDFKAGQTVRLKSTVKHHTCPAGRDNHRTAVITAVLPAGGLFFGEDLRGCKWWNVVDVELVN